MRKSVLRLLALLSILGLVYGVKKATDDVVPPPDSPANRFPSPLKNVTTPSKWASATLPTIPPDPDKINRLISQWGDVPPADREAAEVALQRGISAPEFAMFEKAVADQKDLSSDAREFLTGIIERERPRVAARLQIANEMSDCNTWIYRNVMEEYEAIGRKNPKWDADVRDGLTAYFTFYIDRRKAFDLLSRAVDQEGCDDPMVVYYFARLLETFGDPKKTRACFQNAWRQIQSTQYSAYRQETVILRAFKYIYSAERASMPAGTKFTREFQSFLGRTYDELCLRWPAVVAQQGVPEQVLRELAIDIIEHEMLGGKDAIALYDHYAAPLKEALPATSTVPLELEGAFYIKYAWDARGGGYANTVTADGWKLFHERLQTARAALEKAWGLNATLATVPQHMLTVGLGQSWSVDQMMVWFDRGMKIDPDGETLCDSMINYLQPKWHGSPQDMIDFGHHCLEMRNWNGSTPFVIVTAHKDLAAMAPDENAYWHYPEVWTDMQAVYLPYIKAEPKNTRVRCHYCYACCRTGHWDAAAAQFALLDENVHPGPFGSRDVMEGYRMQAMDRVKKGK